jgi:hypothetical protein
MWSCWFYCLLCLCFMQGLLPGFPGGNFPHAPRVCIVQEEFFWVTRGGADSHRLTTHSNQASPTAGGPRQSLTSEIRLTPLIGYIMYVGLTILWYAGGAEIVTTPFMLMLCTLVSACD